MRQAVQEIRGAIQRINDPAAGGVFALDLIAFLTKETIGRTGRHQVFTDQGFGGFVSAADKVTRTF